MLTDQIKKQMIEAMKQKHTVAKEVLRVALGEIQTAEARSGKPPTDDQAAALVRKLIKSNRETLEAGPDEATSERLNQENQILEQLLPQTLDVPQIIDALGDLADQIAAAPSDGAATGLAVKHLKTNGAAVEGKDVAAAVRQMRS